jgi:hypothetical protein
LPDDSGYALLQIDLSSIANGPCSCGKPPGFKNGWTFAYAAVKDGWLFVRGIDAKRLTDVVKREEVAVVIAHSGFWTKISADPSELLQIFKDHASEISDEASVFRRLDADSKNKSDNDRSNASGGS